LLAAATAKPGNANEVPKPAEPAPIQPVSGGNLGVIVVQQSSQDSVLDGADVLTGQPVYTVYFDVPGSPRRWVLQYCVPGAEVEPVLERSETVIRIRPRKSVQPPFPLQRIPLELNGFQGDGRRLVIYALVNARGEVENIKLIRGTGQEIDRTAVATLERWAFRPATRGEEPVAVEALFGIPLQ
jgi:TonB family protein